MRPDQLKEVLRSKMKAALQQSMVAVANEAVNWVKLRFIQQNWVDGSAQPWQQRSAKAKRNKGRAILYDSGHLQRGNDKETITPTGFSLVNRVAYAAVHNYGLTITRHARSERFQRNRFTAGKKKGRFKKGTTAGRGITFKGGSFKMPQRQFIGNSANLRAILARKAQVEILRRMRS